MVYTLVLTSAVFINTFGCSSQSSGSSNGEHDPGPSFSPAGNLFLLAECSSQFGGNPDCEHSPLRARSKSPRRRPDPIKVFGYSLKELGYIRLVPRTNESIQYEFRRYHFPAGKPIRLRADKNRWVPVPTQEHIVLSLSNGDVFAILDYGEFLSAIYRADGQHAKVKINMISGDVDNLTPAEIRDCPAGKKQQIFPRNFIKTSANDDSLRSVWNPHSEPQEPPFRSTTRPLSYRPLPDRVLGVTIKKLGYVRLIPFTNPNQRFEFRKYVFPLNKKIRFRIDNVNYSYEPNQEYMVLSTSDGEIFAIMDHGDILRGIYRTDNTHSRIKINIMSEEVDDLNPDEIRDCPVGKNHPPLHKTFTKISSSHDSLKFTWKPHDGRNPDSSSAGQNSPPKSPPGKPPSREVLGYPLSKLGYIRLIPHVNQNRRFKFRRYVIPSNKPIRLLAGKAVYVNVPAREHIVLTTSTWDVFAILEYTGILRGLYATNVKRSRLKINIISGQVEHMTESELEECHVGTKYPIFPRRFTAEVSNEDSLQHVYH